MIFGLFGKKAKTIDEIAAEIDGFGGSTVAGQVVTERTALEVSTVLSCIEVISDGISVPELHVMRDLGNGRKERATDEGIYRVLHRRPNEFMTSFEFRQTMTMHMALTGNAYALPIRHAISGEITEIWPILGSWVTIEHYDRYDVRYRISDEFGTLGVFAQTDILHLRNRSWDMVRGLSAVKTAAHAIGLSMAAEKNIEALHENGGRPAGVLSTEQKLTPEVIQRIADGWKKVTSGANKYKTALLDNGIKYQAMAMSAVDAQALETRRMQVEEICRAFGVFPIMVGHSDKAATYASAEAFFASHNRKTVAKWQRNWAEKLDEFILDGEGPLFVEFDNQEIRSASLKDQGEFFAKALGTGGGVPFMTINEVRALFGLDPLPDGDQITMPIASTQTPKEAEDEPQDDEA